MKRVEVEVVPWLTRAFGAERGGHLLLEKHLEDGAKFKDLLKELIAEYPSFAEIALDPQSQRLKEHVSVILNDRFLEVAGGLEAELKEGDRVVFLPAFAGGCPARLTVDARTNKLGGKGDRHGQGAGRDQGSGLDVVAPGTGGGLYPGRPGG